MLLWWAQAAGCSAVVRAIVERSLAWREEASRLLVGSEECVEVNWQRVQLIFVVNSMLSLIVGYSADLAVLCSAMSGDTAHCHLSAFVLAFLLQSKEEKVAAAAEPPQQPVLTVRDIAGKVAAAFKDLVSGSMSAGAQLDKVRRFSWHVPPQQEEHETV